ncbi:MAG TPA: E3 binding domain-containing protein, partial [Nitrosomonas sp.]|nr:E3 binding domain-containing protein [Nitrosomonas sp.]
MLIEVKVPVLSESVAEATLVSWHKKQGDAVKRDENLIDVETDKVVLELPAPQSGVLKEIIKGDGATVTSGEVIATIDTEATGTAESAEAEKKSPESAKEEAAAKKTGTGEMASDAAQEADVTIPMLMPAARKLAEENHLKASETESIKGTGRGGRITREDVQDYLERRTKENRPERASAQEEKSGEKTAVAANGAAAPGAAETGGGRIDRRVTMSRLRMRIAERL